MRKPTFLHILWPLYSDIISLLTSTVGGYQISIAYCLFFIDDNSKIILPFLHKKLLFFFY